MITLIRMSNLHSYTDYIFSSIFLLLKSLILSCQQWFNVIAFTLYIALPLLVKTLDITATFS